jgi:uncharacterized protein YbjT (DUF2867 family)
MVETILVTGATGTVGSEVVKQLSQRKENISIRAAIHSQNKSDNLKQIINNDKRIELIDFDYNEPINVQKAIDNVDKIFLVTTPSPNSSDMVSYFIKEAKRNGIKHIVKLSVMNADAQPGYAMGRLHRVEEKIIEESQIPYTFLRPTTFMQNFINYFDFTIKNQNAFYFHGGDVPISFVDARDIAAVATNILSLTEDQHAFINKSINVTGPESLSYSQAAEILSKEIGRTITYLDVSEDDARNGMKQSGMSDWLINIIMDSLNYIIRGEYGSQTSEAIEQIIGRKPTVFVQFVRDYLHYFR